MYIGIITVYVYYTPTTTTTQKRHKKSEKHKSKICMFSNQQNHYKNQRQHK